VSYIPAYVPLGEGAAQLQDAISELRTSDFDGPISVHTEYTSDPSVVATVGGADESAAAARLRASGEIDDLKKIRLLWGD
jgi:sugar phosphate isomerase/epimerase